MFDEKGLGDYGTDAARTEQPSQDGNQMDEKNGQVAHRRMVAGRGILRNLGKNINSPATGYHFAIVSRHQPATPKVATHPSYSLSGTLKSARIEMKVYFGYEQASRVLCLNDRAELHKLENVSGESIVPETCSEPHEPLQT